MDNNYIKKQKKFYSWLGVKMLEDIRDHPMVSKKYKDKINFGIQALKTGDDKLFEKSLPEYIFHDGYTVGYAWDVAVPS